MTPGRPPLFCDLAPLDSSTRHTEGESFGGQTIVDPVNYVYQASIYRNHKVTVVPPPNGDFPLSAIAANDDGLAVVWLGSGGYGIFDADQGSWEGTLPAGWWLWAGGTINNHGLVATNSYGPAAIAHLYDARNRSAIVLAPADPSEPKTMTYGINEHSHVVGKSFNEFSSGSFHQHIGLWDRHGNFQSYLALGAADGVTGWWQTSPHVNDHDEVVIGVPYGRAPTAYLVPRAGVKLALASLVRNLPQGQDVAFLSGFNNRGDVLGYSSDVAHTFLLVRMGDEEREPDEVHLGPPPELPPGEKDRRQRVLRARQGN